jgi:predicted helicase
VYPILKIKDGNIEIDELTTLCGVPAQALAYKLGNRSAIEWILDQYKPYKSDDKTIQEQFNNYNFADYKEQVIDLLQKVCWVSVETMKIVGEL